MKKFLVKTLAVLLCVIVAVPQVVRAEETTDGETTVYDEVSNMTEVYDDAEMYMLMEVIEYEQLDSNLPIVNEIQVRERIMDLAKKLKINDGNLNVGTGIQFTVNGSACGHETNNAIASKCTNCKNTNVIQSAWFKDTFGYTVNVNNLPGHFDSPSGSVTSSAWTCAGFVNFALWYIAKEDSNSDVYRDLLGAQGQAFTRESLENSGIRIGDVIRIYSGGKKWHSVMFLSFETNNTIKVLDCNWVNGVKNNIATVKIHAMSLDPSAKIAITRARNYKPDYNLEIVSPTISLPAPIASASSVQAKSNIINYAISLVGWNREMFASAGCSDVPSGDWCTWFLRLCAAKTGTGNLFSTSNGVSGFCADMIRNYGAQGFYYTDSSYLTEADRQVLSGAQAVTKSTFSPQVGDIYILHESEFGDLSQVGFVADVVDGSIYAVVGNNGTAKEVQLRNSPTNTFYQIANNVCPVVGYIRPDYGALDRIQLNGITLNTTQLTMQIGEQSALTVNYNPSNTTDSKTVTWSSSNTNVVSVSNGTVIANGAGNAVITAACNGKTAVCSITVRSKETPSVPVTPEVNANVTAFVNRLYSLVLNRDADSIGLNSWTNALVGRTSSGIDIGYGFVFSPECINRNLSNDAFVEMLYQTFMNRGSDAGGKAAWVSQLDAGVEREKVFEGFVMSAEFANICSQYNINVGTKDSVGAFAAALNQYRNRNADVTKFVARCYTQALERGYETAGLEDWCRVILQKSNTPKQVAQNFIFSAEFAQKGLSDEEYVKVLYRTFMGREADAGGLAAWVEVLKSGREDREKVLEGFSDSVEFDGILQSFGLN